DCRGQCDPAEGPGKSRRCGRQLPGSRGGSAYGEVDRGRPADRRIGAGFGRRRFGQQPSEGSPGKAVCRGGNPPAGSASRAVYGQRGHDCGGGDVSPVGRANRRLGFERRGQSGIGLNVADRTRVDKPRDAEVGRRFAAESCSIGAESPATDFDPVRIHREVDFFLWTNSRGLWILWTLVWIFSWINGAVPTRFSALI